MFASHHGGKGTIAWTALCAVDAPRVPREYAYPHLSGTTNPVTAEACRDQTGINTGLNCAGYSCKKLKAAGCSAKNLVDAGCSAKDLSVPVTAEWLKAAGCSAKTWSMKAAA